MRTAMTVSLLCLIACGRKEPAPAAPAAPAVQPKENEEVVTITVTGMH